MVSSDFVGNRHAAIVDSRATLADGRHCVLYVWYDNEFGYSCQVIRVMQEMSGLHFPNLPVDPGVEAEAGVAARDLSAAK